jgi:hypothetical protein
MKRLFLFALALVSLSALFGCQQPDEGDKFQPGVATGPKGEALTPDQIKNAPKAEGAFDGTGGPGLQKGKGAGGK